MHAMKHKLEDMLQQLDKYLNEEKLTSKTISAYRASFRSLKKFAAEKKLCGYSNVIGDLFLQHRFGVTRYEKGYLPPSVAVAIRVVWMLSSLLENQKLKSIYHHNQPSIFPPCFQKVLCEYERHYFYSSKSIHTWIRIKGLLTKFFNFIVSQHVHSFMELRQEHIEAYFYNINNLSKMTIATEKQRLKRFILFLEQKGYSVPGLHLFLPHVIVYQKSYIPSTWKEEEIRTLLLSIDRSTAIGKRDYAMLLIAVQMGIRSADIKNLKLQNLYWSDTPSECAIDFIQEKTGNQFTQPMPYDVAAALIDYLKNGRPTSNDQHVFLRHKSHIGRLHGGTSRIYRLIKKANLDFGTRKHGFHSLRHTFATRLVANGTPLKIVSELMGHASITSTGTYISVDFKSLRRCALNPLEVNNEGK